MEEFRRRKIDPHESLDWIDVNANVEDVTFDDIPLDGLYLEHLLESLED